MINKINILNVEDSAEDSSLIEQKLAKAGLEIKMERVDTVDAMNRMLDTETWDIILLDYYIPGFGALQALKLLTGRRSQTPVIIVSGSTSKTEIDEAKKAGASDYVSKQDLNILAPAIRRQLGGETAETKQRTEKKSVAIKKASILIVDDNPDKMLALESVLKSLDQELVKVNSGKNALRELLLRDFAVILLDVQMPEMDGFETAAMIRKRKRTENTPIIFITAISQSETAAKKGYSLGAVDYIFAPVVPAILQAKVQVFVELYHMRAEVELQAIQLANANRELEAFSYSVSHDLHAPLRAIEGFSQALLEDCGASLDQTGKHHLERILEGTKRMGSLIDDLLQLARITRMEMKTTNFDATAIVKSVADELGRAERTRHVEFTIAPGVSTLADSALFKIIVENLLNNAWKFTSKKELATIEYGVLQKDRKQVHFVRDNGAGFNMAYSDQLFTPFRRLHSPADFQGTGIGLSIVQRIVRRHGGEIWGEAEIGKGATFYFTLE